MLFVFYILNSDILH